MEVVFVPADSNARDLVKVALGQLPDFIEPNPSHEKGADYEEANITIGIGGSDEFGRCNGSFLPKTRTF